MNDLVEQILELIKGKKTAIDMQVIMFQSRSTTYRKLKDEGTSISEIKNLYQDCGAFSVIRKKDDMSRRAFKEELSKFLLCDPDDVWKRFNERYHMGVIEYKKKIKKKNQLTDLEFDLLKRQILFIIRREPHTLKQLCEITNRSRSYVLAALKDLDQVLGGYGGGLGKGYFIVRSEKERLLHASWCANWKKSMQYC